jgi:hypothetical protein
MYGNEPLVRHGIFSVHDFVLLPRIPFSDRQLAQAISEIIGRTFEMDVDDEVQYLILQTDLLEARLERERSLQRQERLTRNLRHLPGKSDSLEECSTQNL